MSACIAAVPEEPFAVAVPLSKFEHHQTSCGPFIEVAIEPPEVFSVVLTTAAVAVDKLALDTMGRPVGRWVEELLL
jgi:hypothetical protein